MYRVAKEFALVLHEVEHEVEHEVTGRKHDLICGVELDWLHALLVGDNLRSGGLFLGQESE